MAASSSYSRALPGRRIRADVNDNGLREIVYRLLCVFWFALPGEGVLTVGGAATIAKAAGVLVAGVGALSVIRTGRRIPVNDYILLVLAFTAWVTLSTFWTVTPDASQQRVLTMAQLAILVLITWEFAHTRRQIRGLMTAWIVGSALVAVIITAAWALGESQTRYTAPGTHAGDQAYALLLAIPMAWYLGMRAVRPALMVVYRLFVPFACLAVVLTASRAGLVSMGLALLIIPLTLSRMPARLRVAVGAGVLASGVGAALLVSAASGPIARLSTTSSEITSGTLDQRTQLWSIALRIISAHPILGLGTGGSKTAIGSQYSTDHGVHDTFLSIGAELGLVGLALFLLVCLAAMWPMRTGLPWLEQRLAWVLIAVFIVSLVPRQDDYVKSTWAILTLFALMGTVLPTRSAEIRARIPAEHPTATTERDRLASAPG